MEWAEPIVKLTALLLTGGGIAGLLKVWVDRRRLYLEETTQMADRERHMTARGWDEAEDWRDKYFRLQGRVEELLEQLSDERARAARLEGRLERMETSLHELSTSTGDFILQHSETE